MLFAGAVTDLSIAETLEDPRWRPLMLAIAREVLAQSPVTPEGFDGFEPDDLEGSLDRLAAFNRRQRQVAQRDLPRPGGPQAQDRGRRPAGRAARPADHPVAELIQSIERGERTCEVANLELLAAYERSLRDS